jgi:hypothetical protein
LDQLAPRGDWSIGNPEDADPDCIEPGFLPAASPLWIPCELVLSMTKPSTDDRTLLEQLDARQDEVLGQIDDLNEQLEKVLEGEQEVRG